MTKRVSTQEMNDLGEESSENKIQLSSPKGKAASTEGNVNICWSKMGALTQKECDGEKCSWRRIGRGISMRVWEPLVPREASAGTQCRMWLWASSAKSGLQAARLHLDWANFFVPDCTFSLLLVEYG